jgi:hypothetical protein
VRSSQSTTPREYTSAAVEYGSSNGRTDTGLPASARVPSDPGEFEYLGGPLPSLLFSLFPLWPLLRLLSPGGRDELSRSEARGEGKGARPR